MIVEEIFQKYKEITCQIIKKLNDDEEIDFLMDERQRILEGIGSMDISSEEKKAVYERLNIRKCEEELGASLKEKMDGLKKEIEIGKKRRSAFSTYNSNMRQSSLFVKEV